MSTAELFIEVRSEELPPGWGQTACAALAKGVTGLLGAIPHGAVRTWSSPRRIAISISDVAPERPRVEKLVTGPPVQAAFRDGAPTRAAEGFARGKGVSVDALEIVDGPKGQVVAARLQEGGESTPELIASGLAEVVLGIPFKKSMRWGANSVRWGRPIHGVCAVYGGASIALTIGDLASAAESTGHRRYAAPFAVSNADAWLAALREHRVIADAPTRREQILEGLQAAAAREGVDVRPDPELLDEVVDLVEWPVVVTCRLDPDFLDLPPKLLVESMRVHQRVFPTWETGTQDLSPVFLTVSNNPDGDDATIAIGNARVLSARFSDARFFFAEDQKRRLEVLGEKLERMQWIRGLGTMADRQQRLRAVAGRLTQSVYFDGDHDAAHRAAELCKCDLTSLMVGEFPKLQGHMGRHYALRQGEDPRAAEAIEDHYLPRFSGDALPQTAEGRALAVADRLDVLSGCFSVGIIPKGGADPQGLRRAAGGLCAILRDAGISMSLEELFAPALTTHAAHAKRDLNEVQGELVEFTLARLKAQLQGDGLSAGCVDAAFGAAVGSKPDTDVVDIAARSHALGRLAALPEFTDLRVAFKRVMGLTKDHFEESFRSELFESPTEHALSAALDGVRSEAKAAADSQDYDRALALMSQLKAPVDAFFEAVLVMCEDEAVRLNRLGLLRSIANLFRMVADFTRFTGEGDRR